MQSARLQVTKHDFLRGTPVEGLQVKVLRQQRRILQEHIKCYFSRDGGDAGCSIDDGYNKSLTWAALTQIAS